LTFLHAVIEYVLKYSFKVDINRDIKPIPNKANKAIKEERQNQNMKGCHL
jgi:hypothetical protein